jgi:GTPase SAR1 family protein
MSKKQAKLSRFMDVMDASGGGAQGFLCERCKSLQSDDIWSAYDALRDVEPNVFFDQLKLIVSRRRFGLCIVVVDVTDSEHTAVRNLRDAIGKTGAVLVWNKVDLLPRFGSHEKRVFEKKLKNFSFINSFACSAETGYGLGSLAQFILENLGGRDVFCVGAANVGKSTLVKKLSEMIAQSVYLKGSGRQANRRRELTSSLKVTGSSLPGTTLQAVRVPCFGSHRHALWDTPGIINKRAIQYHIFPSHLMEPLTRPGKIDIPTMENGLACQLRHGYSILVQSTWMLGEDGQGEECVLARVDLIDCGDEGRSIYAQAYLHPSLQVRVVLTSEAPDRAVIPSPHIRRIQEKIRDATKNKETGLADAYSEPLKPFIHDKEKFPSGELITGASEMNLSGRFRMDVVFASLGWIAFTHGQSFKVIPHCVQGSVFSKRKSVYPTSFDEESVDDEWEEQQVDVDLRRAAELGRHRSNRTRGVSDSYEGDFPLMYDEW